MCYLSLSGVIMHGHGRYGFFEYHQYPHGPDLTATILLKVLNMLEELPPTLYIQLDNSGKDNKNRFMFGLCWLLVEMGVFDSQSQLFDGWTYS
jgi:hypothetical protein